MSKPSSGLFEGTPGETAFYGDAEAVIAERARGLDLTPHPIQRKELSTKKRREIRKRIENRTASRKEYEAYKWDRRFRKRRRKATDDFWSEEAKLLAQGLRGTRNWSESDRLLILSGKTLKWNGKSYELHHAYAAKLYPQLANRWQIIFPATHYEHHQGWHGGNYRKSLPGRRIRRINETGR